MSNTSGQITDAEDSQFELIEFRLDRNINGKVVRGIYGVNVVKVREVVRMPKINAELKEWLEFLNCAACQFPS